MRPPVPPDLEVPLQEVELYLRAAEDATADRVHRLEGAVADLEDLLRLLLCSSAPSESVQAEQKGSSSRHEGKEGAGREDVGADDVEMGELGRRIEEALGSARAVRGYADSPRSRGAAGGANSLHLASSSSSSVPPLVTPPLPKKPPVPDRRGVVPRSPTCATRESTTSTTRHRRVSSHPLSTPDHRRHHHHHINISNQQQQQVQRPHTKGSPSAAARTRHRKTASAPEGAGRTPHATGRAGGAAGAGGGGGGGGSGRARNVPDTEADYADGPSLEVVCERVQKLREGEKELKAAVKEAREKLSVREDLAHAHAFARGLLHKLQTEQTEQHDVYGCTSDDDDDDEGASSDLYDRLLASAMASSSSASPPTTSSSSAVAAAASSCRSREMHTWSRVRAEQPQACNTDLELRGEEGPIWASPSYEEALEAEVGKRLLPSLVKAFRRQAEAASSSSSACVFSSPQTSTPRGPQSSSMQQHRGNTDVCTDSTQITQNEEWAGLLRVCKMAHTMLLAGRCNGPSHSQMLTVVESYETGGCS